MNPIQEMYAFFTSPCEVYEGRPYSELKRLAEVARDTMGTPVIDVTHAELAMVRERTNQTTPGPAVLLGAVLRPEGWQELPGQWTTRDGITLPVSLMTTRHLYHTIRYLKRTNNDRRKIFKKMKKEYALREGGLPLELDSVVRDPVRRSSVARELDWLAFEGSYYRNYCED